MWRTLILLSVMQAGFAQPVRVMTYNIRYNTAADGPNAWPNRSATVIALLKAHQPDVLGVQEALHGQVVDLKNGLLGYSAVGVGRDDGKERGEYSALFFNKKRFFLVDWGTFWLSETPETPGSKSWDAAITRIATWAVLVDRKRKDSMLVVNTHFDHMGQEARLRSASLIKEKISNLAGRHKVLLVGDFNMEPSEKPYATLTDGTVFNLKDAGAGSAMGTFCSFQVNTIPCKRIDYIFYGAGWAMKKYAVITQNNKKFYPSDHLPVVSVLKPKK